MLWGQIFVILNNPMKKGDRFVIFTSLNKGYQTCLKAKRGGIHIRPLFGIFTQMTSVPVSSFCVLFKMALFVGLDDVKHTMLSIFRQQVSVFITPLAFLVGPESDTSGSLEHHDHFLGEILYVFVIVVGPLCRFLHADNGIVCILTPIPSSRR